MVTLPDLVGRRVPGLRQDAEGFIAVDAHGRVPGVDGVYAAGDVTTFPLKQGGLATQQADAAVETCSPHWACPSCRGRSSRSSRASSTPIASRPISAPPSDGRGSAPRPYAMWWPPSKIAGRHLAPYLAIRGGAPRAPEVRPEHDAIPVTIDMPCAVRAVSNALDPSAVPPG